MESFGAFCEEPQMILGWLSYKEIYETFLKRFVQARFFLFTLRFGLISKIDYHGYFIIE